MHVCANFPFTNRPAHHKKLRYNKFMFNKEPKMSMCITPKEKEEVERDLRDQRRDEQREREKEEAYDDREEFGRYRRDYD
jgi:hypothetical protein